MSKKLIIGLVGEVRSGKTTMAGMLEKLLEPGIRTVVVSDAQAMGAALPHMIPQEWERADVIVYDCIRASREYDSLRSFRSSLLIHIDASTPSRFERYCHGTGLSLLSVEAQREFGRLDMHPREGYDPNFALVANAHIRNSDTPETLKANVQALIKREIEPRLEILKRF